MVDTSGRTYPRIIQNMNMISRAVKSSRPSSSPLLSQHIAITKRPARSGPTHAWGGGVTYSSVHPRVFPITTAYCIIAVSFLLRSRVHVPALIPELCIGTSEPEPGSIS